MAGICAPAYTALAIQSAYGGCLLRRPVRDYEGRNNGQAVECRD